MYRIMIVEDNAKVRQQVAVLLTRQGYQALEVENFSEVRAYYDREKPDLVLLDINLPESDGFQICRELRQDSDVPVVFLTSRDSQMDEVVSMTLGGDDFITKPYTSEVLLARIGAVLRRTYGRSTPGDILVHGGLTLSLSSGIVIHAGQQVELTKNELKILHMLLEHSGDIVTRDALMERLWSSDLFVDDNTLTVNINRLRRKLEELGLDEFIETRRGQGYRVP